MNKILSTSIIIILLLSLVSVVYATDSSSSLCSEINKGSAVGLKLKITYNAQGAGSWLGVTLYTPNPKDIPYSQIFPLKSGASTTELIIDPKYVNGTFEAAIYTKKLNKTECDPKDEVCQKNGYKLTGLAAYIWRYIVSP
jgi:hypothetical protein